MPADIRVDCHGINKTFVVLAVEELEAVHPHLFDVAGVNPTVTIRGYKGGGKNVSSNIPQKKNHDPKGKHLLHFLINIIGGKSSAYQLAGISHRPVVTPGSKGFIQWSGCLE
jgi:hypothetical protein